MLFFKVLLKLHAALLLALSTSAYADIGVGVRGNPVMSRAAELSISQFWNEGHVTSINYMMYRELFPKQFEKAISIEHGIALSQHWFFDFGLGVINRRSESEICEESVSAGQETHICYEAELGTKASFFGYSLGVRYLKVNKNWYWEFVPVRGTRPFKVIHHQKGAKISEYGRSHAVYGAFMLGIGVNI